MEYKMDKEEKLYLEDNDCSAAFKASSASKSSKLVSAKAISRDFCTIEADCYYHKIPGDPGNAIKRSSITLKYDDVPSLSNCNGELKKGNC